MSGLPFKLKSTLLSFALVGALSPSAIALSQDPEMESLKRQMQMPRGPINPELQRLVDSQALGQAWRALDSVGVTDAALQLLEAERVLGIKDPFLSSDLVFNLALRMASNSGDTAQMDRLEKAAVRAKREDLTGKVLVVRKTGAQSRNVEPIKPITPQDDPALIRQLYGAFQHDIEAAMLLGDARSLGTIESDLKEIRQFNPQQRESLQHQIDTAKTTATDDQALSSTLDKLVSDSRIGVSVKFQGIKSGIRVTTKPETQSTLGIVETSPRRQEKEIPLGLEAEPEWEAASPSKKKPNRPQGQQPNSNPYQNRKAYEERQALMMILNTLQNAQQQQQGVRRW